MDNDDLLASLEQELAGSQVLAGSPLLRSPRGLMCSVSPTRPAFDAAGTDPLAFDDDDDLLVRSAPVPP